MKTDSTQLQKQKTQNQLIRFHIQISIEFNYIRRKTPKKNKAKSINQIMSLDIDSVPIKSEETPKK